MSTVSIIDGNFCITGFDKLVIFDRYGEKLDESDDFDFTIEDILQFNDHYLIESDELFYI